jgi:hypothetical protein
VLGEVHHDARARSGRQDAPSRQREMPPRPWDPNVDTGIRPADLVVTEAVALGKLSSHPVVTLASSPITDEPSLGSAYVLPCAGTHANARQARPSNRRPPYLPCSLGCCALNML